MKIDQNTLISGVEFLCKKDKYLAQVINLYGTPPLWDRKPGFETMVQIILEQQVSLASAKAAFNKLESDSGKITPQKFIQFSDARLKEFGFSRQKTEYCRYLANALLNNRFNFEELETQNDDQALKMLTRLKGIGPWSANIYLLMAMGRPDTWPDGDLALVNAVSELYKLNHPELNGQIRKFTESWRPYRSVAARILWHFYLSSKNKS